MIAANRPILILDEPQKMEGKATNEMLPLFNPLVILRYSATHRTIRNLVYRLDAKDGYGRLDFENGLSLVSGQAAGNVSETELRRIQIREAVKAHLDKEKLLFQRGIKVLTFFFIDEVKKYLVYADNQDATGLQGEYAAIFEEEYAKAVGERLGDMLLDSELIKYWSEIAAADTHAGYFAEDKKHRLVDSKEKEGGSEDDRDAYALAVQMRGR